MDCPLECDWISYDVQISSSEYPTRELYELYKQTDGKNNMNLTFSQYKDDYILLNVFYPYLKCTEIVEKPKVTLADLFANVGGSMGIFLGFSVFSVIEFGELFVRIIYSVLFKRN